MQEENFGEYRNPFLLPKKVKPPEKITRGPTSESTAKQKPKLDPKKQKTLRIGLIITVSLFSVGCIFILMRGILTPTCGDYVCDKGELISCPDDCSTGVEKQSLFSQVFLPSSENESGQQPNPAEQPPLPNPNMEYICDNTLDDDYDGKIDCYDSDCEYSEVCETPSLFVFDMALISPIQTNPAFVELGQNLTIKFIFTVDLNPITSNLIVKDLRIGNQQCGWLGNLDYNLTESMWNIVCTLPSNLMGAQHLFLQVEANDFNETRAKVEFLAVIFPVRSFVYNVSLTSPSSKLTLAAGKSFDMSCRAFTNNATGISLAFQYRSNASAFMDVETTAFGNLTISEPNPETNVVNGTVYRHQVTANINGTYFIRCKADNGTFSLGSDLIEVNVSVDVNNPPSEVSNLHAVSSGNSWIYFIWGAALDDFGIQYYVLFNNGEHVANTTSLEYNLTSLAQSTSYNFSVVAMDTAGNYGLPTTIEASTLGDTPPSAVSNLVAASSGSNWIQFNWNAATDDVGIDKYILSLNSVNLANTTGLFFNATGLTPSTTYTFAVKAQDTSGKTGQETSVQAATQQEVFSGGSVILRAMKWFVATTGKLISIFRP